MKTRLVLATPHDRFNSLENALRKVDGWEVFRVENSSQLTLENLSRIKPHYVFFPQWPSIIKPEIFQNFECIIFHMTDLPYGRGGSPLQNLILRGHKSTKLSAIRCVTELDAGPIYFKRDLSLQGTAEDILLRVGNLVFEMIKYIVCNKPVPIEQTGEPTMFKRRSPKDGNLINIDQLDKLYDFIRMLDGDGYPRAFIETNTLKFEFYDANSGDDNIIARVKITRRFK